MQEQETNKPVPETTMMLDDEEEEEQEERYVKVASRFFRVKRGDVGGGGLHYLASCFLCKTTIACDRDVFMYRDAAFCSVDCREDQMDMDEALHATARRHRLLLHRAPSSSSSSPAAAEAAAFRTPPVMRRRPTIANLAARNPPVAAS